MIECKQTDDGMWVAIAEWIGVWSELVSSDERPTKRAALVDLMTTGCRIVGEAAAMLKDMGPNDE